jgi:urease accessory protein
MAQVVHARAIQARLLPGPPDNVPQCGALEYDVVQGCTTVTRSRSTYPLRFIIPLSNRQKDNAAASTSASSAPTADQTNRAISVSVLSFGGGLVAGDQVGYTCVVHPMARAVLTTQASTKVFKCRGEIPANASQPAVPAENSSQYLRARVGAGALLMVTPDPITCFEHARYQQFQQFELADESCSLVVVDWLTSGRISRGESWAFGRYESENRVVIGDSQELLLRDRQVLDNNVSGGFAASSVGERMGPAHVVALVILCGPEVAGVVDALKADSKRVREKAVPMNSFDTQTSPRVRNLLLHSWSPLVHDGAYVVRVAAAKTEDVRAYLKELLLPMAHLVEGGGLYEI